MPQTVAIPGTNDTALYPDDWTPQEIQAHLATVAPTPQPQQPLTYSQRYLAAHPRTAAPIAPGMPGGPPAPSSGGLVDQGLGVLKGTLAGAGEIGLGLAGGLTKGLADATQSDTLRDVAGSIESWKKPLEDFAGDTVGSKVGRFVGQAAPGLLSPEGWIADVGYGVANYGDLRDSIEQYEKKTGEKLPWWKEYGVPLAASVLGGLAMHKLPGGKAAEDLVGLMAKGDTSGAAKMLLKAGLVSDLHATAYGATNELGQAFYDPEVRKQFNAENLPKTLAEHGKEFMENYLGATAAVGIGAKMNVGRFREIKRIQDASAAAAKAAVDQATATPPAPPPPPGSSTQDFREGALERFGNAPGDEHYAPTPMGDFREEAADRFGNAPDDEHYEPPPPPPPGPPGPPSFREQAADRFGNAAADEHHEPPVETQDFRQSLLERFQNGDDDHYEPPSAPPGPTDMRDIREERFREDTGDEHHEPPPEYPETPDFREQQGEFFRNAPDEEAAGGTRGRKTARPIREARPGEPVQPGVTGTFTTPKQGDVPKSATQPMDAPTQELVKGTGESLLGENGKDLVPGKAVAMRDPAVKAAQKASVKNVLGKAARVSPDNPGIDAVATAVSDLSDEVSPHKPPVLDKPLPVAHSNGTQAADHRQVLADAATDQDVSTTQQDADAHRVVQEAFAKSMGIDTRALTEAQQDAIHRAAVSAGAIPANSDKLPLRTPVERTPLPVEEPVEEPANEPPPEAPLPEEDEPEVEKKPQAPPGEFDYSDIAAKGLLSVDALKKRAPVVDAYAEKYGAPRKGARIELPGGRSGIIQTDDILAWERRNGKERTAPPAGDEEELAATPEEEAAKQEAKQKAKKAKPVKGAPKPEPLPIQISGENLNPMLLRKLQDTMSDLYQRLMHSGLEGHVQLRFVDRLRSTAGQAALGRFGYDDGMPYIVLSLEGLNPDISPASMQRHLAGFFTHEFTHALRDFGLISDEEWKVLVDKAKTVKYAKEQYGGAETPWELAEHQYAKEADARKLTGKVRNDLLEHEAVAIYMQDTMTGEFPKSSTGKRVLEKTGDFIARARRVLGGGTFQSANDIFQKANFGDIRKRVELTRRQSSERKQQDGQFDALARYSLTDPETRQRMLAAQGFRPEDDRQILPHDSNGWGPVVRGDPEAQKRLDAIHDQAAAYANAQSENGLDKLREQHGVVPKRQSAERVNELLKGPWEFRHAYELMQRIPEYLDVNQFSPGELRDLGQLMAATGKTDPREALAMFSQKLRGDPLGVGLKNGAAVRSVLEEQGGDKPGVKSFGENMLRHVAGDDTVPLSSNGKLTAQLFGVPHGNLDHYQGALHAFAQKYHELLATEHNRALGPEGEAPGSRWSHWQMEAMLSHNLQLENDRQASGYPNLPPDLNANYPTHFENIKNDLQRAKILSGDQIDRETLLDPRTASLLYPDAVSEARPVQEEARGAAVPNPNGKRRTSSFNALARPNYELRSLADEYKTEKGIGKDRPVSRQSISVPAMKRLADLYHRLPHDPDDPKTAAAYQALKNETLDQFRKLDVKLEPTGKAPYKSSGQMVDDARHNRHLWYTPGAGDGSHPLDEASGEVDSEGNPLTHRDLFNAAHDLFGHGQSGHSYGPEGDLNAYLDHSRMYSDEAKPALAAETLGRNAWADYGPYVRRMDGSIPEGGEPDYTPPGRRVLPEDKAAVLPGDVLRDVEQRPGSASFDALARGWNPDTTDKQKDVISGALNFAEPDAASWAARWLKPQTYKDEVPSFWNKFYTGFVSGARPVGRRQEKLLGRQPTARESVQKRAEDVGHIRGAWQHMLAEHGGAPVEDDGWVHSENVVRKGAGPNGTDKKIGGLLSIVSPLLKQGLFKEYSFWHTAKRRMNLQLAHPEVALTPEEQVVFDDFDKKHGQQFNETYHDLSALNTAFLDYAVKKGLMSKEMRQKMTQYGDYIPLKGMMEDPETSGLGGSNQLAGVSNILTDKFRGSKEGKMWKSEDPLLMMMKNHFQIFNSATRNDAAQRSIDMFKATGSNIRPLRPSEQVKSGEHSFFVWEDGKRQRYATDDKEAFDMLRHIETIGQLHPALGKLVRGATSILRFGATKNPAFAAANIIRDITDARMLSGNDFNFVTEPLRVLSAVLGITKNEYTGYLEHLKSTGIAGDHSILMPHDPLDSSIRQLQMSKALPTKGWEGVKNSILDKLIRYEHLIDNTDQVARLLVFKHVLNKTKAAGMPDGDIVQALHEANMTMPFNRHGSSGILSLARTAIPFINSRFQGADVLGRAFAGQSASAGRIGSRASRNKALMNAGLMALATTLYSAFSSGQPYYENASDDVRDNYWLIPVGGGHAAKIPTPFEFGLFAKTVPERLFRAFGLHKELPSTALRDVGRQFLSNMAIQPPALINAPLAVKTNYDMATGQPIVDQPTSKLQPSYQYRPDTSLLSRFLVGKVWNPAVQAAGGEGTSPMYLDKLITGYTGTTGLYLLQLMDAAARATGAAPAGPSARFVDYPMVGHFFARSDGGQLMGQFYGMQQTLDQAMASLRRIPPEDRQAFMERNKNLLASQQMVQQIAAQLTRLKQAEHQVMASPSLGPDVQRERLTQLRQAELQAVQAVPILHRFQVTGQMQP